MPHFLKEARVLANYIQSMDVFHSFEYTPHSPYNHVGALFTDIILQSGLNYSTVVRPRVARVYNLFPEANCISGFEKTIDEFGINYVLNWKTSTKTDRILMLIEFSKSNFIETESDLLNFLSPQKNRELFLELNGIGFKTLDYTLKLLCVDCVAVDRHIYTFINNAGIQREKYNDVKKIVEFAADLLETPRIKVDKFIWNLISNKSNNQIRMNI